jgi:hypothetical protein
VDALDADVGVLAAEVDGAGERGVGQRGQRQGEERLVDGAEGATCLCLPAGARRLFASLLTTGGVVGPDTG